MLDNQYHEIPITSLHALVVMELPTYHKDPFDRILLAQAKCEGIPLITADKVLKRYPGPILFVEHGA